MKVWLLLSLCSPLHKGGGGEREARVCDAVTLAVLRRRHAGGGGGCNEMAACQEDELMHPKLPEVLT